MPFRFLVQVSFFAVSWSLRTETVLKGDEWHIAQDSSGHWYYWHDNAEPIWAADAAAGPWAFGEAEDPLTHELGLYFVNDQGAGFWQSQLRETYAKGWMAKFWDGIEPDSPQELFIKTYRFVHPSLPSHQFPFVQLVNAHVQADASEGIADARGPEAQHQEPSQRHLLEAV